MITFGGNMGRYFVIYLFLFGFVFTSCSGHLSTIKNDDIPSVDPLVKAQWPKGNAPNQLPIIFTEKNLTSPTPKSAEFLKIQKGIKSKICATYNYADLGLLCGTYGSRSSCVWASGSGWTYFNNYESICLGATKTVCYSSKGSCG
jgi:hypothetical protein